MQFLYEIFRNAVCREEVMFSLRLPLFTSMCVFCLKGLFQAEHALQWCLQLHGEPTPEQRQWLKQRLAGRQRDCLRGEHNMSLLHQ